MSGMVLRARRGEGRGTHHEVAEGVLVRVLEPGRAEAEEVGGADDEGGRAEDVEQGRDVLVRGPEVQDDEGDGRVEELARDLRAGGRARGGVSRGGTCA